MSCDTYRFDNERNLWRTPKPTTTVLPQAKTSSTKRSTGPRAGVKRKKLEATGGVAEVPSRTRMPLLTTEPAPWQTLTVDRKNRILRCPQCPKKMQTSQVDLGSRQGTSLMKAMQNLTLFVREETPTQQK